MQHWRQVFTSNNAGMTLSLTACIPTEKLSKQQLISEIAAFISTRLPSEDITVFRCADRHTATSAQASSGSVIRILVQIKVSTSE
jgi:hypothetical protein